MLSVKEASSTIFKVFGMTRPGDWTQVSRVIGEHSNHYANVQYFLYFIHILNLKFQNEYLVDNILNKQELICLHTNGLVWFYGISTIVGYLMPNPVYLYIR